LICPLQQLHAAQNISALITLHADLRALLQAAHPIPRGAIVLAIPFDLSLSILTMSARYESADLLNANPLRCICCFALCSATCYHAYSKHARCTLQAGAYATHGRYCKQQLHAYSLSNWHYFMFDSIHTICLMPHIKPSVVVSGFA
jgi:hypothetical protein